VPDPRPLASLSFAERLNFLVTNRLPRRWLTLATGRFSKIENPLLARLSIAVWRLFADDLRLHEARESSFRSLHQCFVRELVDGARPVDARPEVVTSPCDAVVGEFGSVRDVEVIQAKGFPYELPELLGSAADAEAYRNARFVTLRLKSSMYHHFHAPCDGRVEGIRYISGDTWNVNPVALKVVERLFCRNERIVIPIHRAGGGPITLVAVAAILVASLRLDGLDFPLNLEYRGPNDIMLERNFVKGEHMGYFEHGSTIVLLAPAEFEFADSVVTGKIIRMGQPLLVPAKPV
jgi:phosphatidylserine decarboxylase